MGARHELQCAIGCNLPFSTANESHVESVVRMELLFNLIWAALSATMVLLWLRFAPRDGASRRMQFVALAVLILVLFPVISVTDDLQAALNPAETDTCLRRSQVLSVAHSVFPAISALPLSNMAHLPFAVMKTRVEAILPAFLPDDPAQSPIQSRPPPVA